MVDDIGVRGIAADGTLADGVNFTDQLEAVKKEPISGEKLAPKDFAEVYFEETKRVRTPVYVLNELPRGAVVAVRLSQPIPVRTGVQGRRRD